MNRTSVVLGLAVIVTSLTASAEASGEGTAVVRVTTNPAAAAGTFRFSGTPAGELTLAGGGQGDLAAAGLAPGEFVSTLDYVDPTILAAGYMLTEISCDDGESTEASTGDVPGHKATFQIEAGETVTCVFGFSLEELGEQAYQGEPACVCPKEGPWKVANHTGEMDCTGSFSINRPLKSSRSSGTIEIRDNCETIIASGLSDDEATIEMHRVAGCGYKGSVGGSQDGIPMIIEFTWQVHSSERITGDLQSTFSKSGMTCKMSRDYELQFGQ